MCTLHVHKTLPVALQSSVYTRQNVGNSPFPTSFLLPSKLSVSHSVDGNRISHINSAAKSLQSCPTLCNPIDGSPPGSTIPGILHARTLEWLAISFNAWKWKVKVKLLSRVRLLATPWTAAHQAPCPSDFPGKSTDVGCHCLPTFEKSAKTHKYTCIQAHTWNSSWITANLNI